MKLTTEKFQHILRLQRRVEHYHRNDSVDEKQSSILNWPSEPEKALFSYWDGLEEIERQELIALKWTGEGDESPQDFPAMVEEAKLHTNISELQKNRLSEYWENAWEKLHTL